MVTERPERSMPPSSAMPLRSTRFVGAASRSFMVGKSVWPPAMIFASSSLPMRFAACRTLVGRWNSKAYI
jgi:hypothetical protein